MLIYYKKQVVDSDKRLRKQRSLVDINAYQELIEEGFKPIVVEELLPTHEIALQCPDV